MSVTRVPKNMPEESVVWAYRHGIVTGMRMRRIYPKKQMSGYVNAPISVLRLADRVRIEWMRRHPAAPEGSK